MKSLSRNVFIFLDLLCLCIFVLGIILFAAIGEPYQRGFFCNDESIQKPYKDSTISTAVAIAVGSAISLAVIVVTEIAWYRKNKSKILEESYINAHSYLSRIPPVIGSIVWVVIVEIYGAALNTFVTDIGKYSCGRLRPHFIDVCKPNWSNVSCKDPRGNYVFITNIVCTQTDSKLMKEARLSFPSGHSSFAAYTMVFLVLYIEAKLHVPKEGKLMKIFIQAVFILMGLYCGYSRVSDYKHHWSDVLAGLVLGTFIAIVMIFKILRPKIGRQELLPEVAPINNPAGDNTIMNTKRYSDNESP